MRNVQRRTIEAPAEVVGALIDQLARPDDPLWPAHAWPPMRLDRPLQVGATGGHGPIRYTVEEYEPGRRVRFLFDPAIGLDGHHELRVEPAGPHTALVHELTGRATGAMALGWPLAVRWLHEALVQDALDNAERATTGTVRSPARWTPWVRLLRRRLVPGPRRVPLPADARLARGTLDRVDLLDAWQSGRPPGASTDPAAWRERMFTRPPRWVAALMALRNLLPAMERLEPRAVFAPLATAHDEILFGADTRHFDLRISLFFGPATVVCSTLARPRTRRGQAYLAAVRRVHPLVARSMLARAVRAAPRPDASPDRNAMRQES